MSLPQPSGSPELSDTDDVLSSAWLEIRGVLQVECTLESGRHWIGALAFLDFEGGTIYLSAPTRFARDWVRNHLHMVLLQKWQNIIPQVIDIEIVIGRRQMKREEGADMQQSLPLVTFNHRGETA